MNILEQVESTLSDYRPRNQREYVALQLARRFDDMPNLARYLLASRQYTRRQLLDAAKQAHTRHELNRTPVSQLFFEILSEWAQRGEAP